MRAAGRLRAAHLTVVDSVIRDSLSGRDAAGVAGAGLGGAISASGGTLVIQRSALIDNQAVFGDGGAVFANGVFKAYNSTFSGNSVDETGGAMCLRGTEHVLVNDTITLNTTGDFGGAVDTRAGTLAMNNNIVAGNLGGVSGGPDVDVRAPATLSVARFNRIGTDQGHTMADGVDGTLVGTNGSPLDPQLDVLPPNDAATPTHALLLGSPALDSAEDSVCESAEIGNVDQRGVERGFDGALRAPSHALAWSVAFSSHSTGRASARASSSGITGPSV